MDQIMQAIANWFNATFMSSGSKALEEAMVNYQQMPSPDLAAPWYQNLWATNFAFAILLGIVAMFVNMVIAARKGELYGFVQAIADLGLVMLIGYFLLAVLYGASYAVDETSKVIVLVTTGSPDPQWYAPMVALKNATDVQGAILLNAVGWASGKLLVLQSYMIMNARYIFAILFVLTFCFYRNNVGAQFFRWVKAALITVVITKLLVILMLALTSRILVATAETGIGAVGTVTAVMAGAMLIGFITFFSLALRKKQKVEVDGKVQTEGQTSPVNGTNSSVLSRQSDSPTSAPKMKQPMSVQQKALSTQSKARKVTLISSGLNTAAKIGGPKLVTTAASINLAAGAGAAAVVGGVIIATDKISASASKVEKVAGTTAIYGEHFDDARTWNRNRKSS